MMAFGERTQVTEPAYVFLWQKSLWGVKHLACLSVVATSKTGLDVHCSEAQLEGEIEISAPYCLVFPKEVVLVLRPVMQTLTWSFKLEKLYFSHLSPVLYLEVPSPPFDFFLLKCSRETNTLSFRDLPSTGTKRWQCLATFFHLALLSLGVGLQCFQIQ